jgi:glycosyltransferase involved in cell wall biosynthesis
VVFHCHGSEFQRFYAQHPEAVKATLLHCDCIIALSQSWKQWFENAIHHPNVVVIKNVIPSPHIHKVKQDTFTLLFLGRLGKRKGTYDMMEILAEHKNEFEGKLQFLYGGDGDVEQITNFVKEHQLDNIAKYQGWVDGEKKIELLNSADAYILPSYNEGLPISVLEAMSYKLPIISTTVGGTPEIVTNQINGFLTSPGDKDAIYNAISTLMNNAEMCLKQGQASFDIVQEHLPDFVAGQLTELYNSLLK